MMRRGRRAVLFATVGLALAASPLLATAGSVKTPPRLSEEQARQRAAAVAKAIGLPWDDTATARFGNMSWAVRCHGAFLYLGGDTGEVVMFQPSPPSAPTSVAKPLTEDETIAIAARAIEAFGAPPDAAFDKAELKGDGTMWNVWWQRRTANGIPYDGDYALILLDSSGPIAGAYLDWSPVPPPTSIVVKVTKQQAMRAAKDFVKRTGLPGHHDQFIEAALRVVQPNDYYTARRLKQRTAEASTPTRVAWAVSLPRPLSEDRARGSSSRRGRGEWVRDIVWVDAADAKVLGGRTAGHWSPPRIRRHDLSLVIWLAPGVLVAALAAAAAYLARRRGGRATTEQER